MRIKAFTDAVKALVRTEDVEQRKQLTVPKEYILWSNCKRWSSLPQSGGYLEQPHILMRLFNIIEREYQEWEFEKAESARKLKEVNDRLKKIHKTKQGR